MSVSVPCCVEVAPEAEGLVRYGLAELLRGLGLMPAWSRRGNARVVVAAGEVRAPAGALSLPVSSAAIAALTAPARPRAEALGALAHDGERWPLPAGDPRRDPTAVDGDLVASAAWWLAGLQEGTAARDAHGRFPFDASLQAALGDGPGGPLRPAVDAYRDVLAGALRQRGVDPPGRRWTGGAPWAVALTHDLDALHTPRLRAFGGEALRGHLGAALRRALGPDVRWQSALALRTLADRRHVRSTWFAKPLAWAPEDLGTHLDDRSVAFLRELMAAGHTVGWHPGYGAHADAARLDAERARFEAALGAPPTVARTHFLRWAEPTTPRLLGARGVRIDSTLGFSRQAGFRRGTALPFRLFDAEAGRSTDVWEMPLAVMDTTLAHHQRLTDAEVARVLHEAGAAAQRSGGVVVVLWHNDLGEGAPWTRRLGVLDRWVGRVRAAGGAVGPLDRLLADWRGSAAA